MLNNILDWIKKTPEAAVGIAGLMGGAFVFILNIIINAIKSKKSKRDIKIKELTEENRKLNEIVKQLTEENNYYKSDDIIEKIDGIDALYHKNFKIWICNFCWYSENKISPVKDDNNNGYFRCLKCGEAGIIDKQIVEQINRTMNNIFSELHN